MVLGDGNEHVYVYCIGRSWKPLLYAVDVCWYCPRSRKPLTEPEDFVGNVAWEPGAMVSI